MNEDILYEGHLYELWKYRSLKINLFITTVLWMVLTVGYYELNLLLKYLEGNMFINSYTLASGEILAKLAPSIVHFTHPDFANLKEW